MSGDIKISVLMWDCGFRERFHAIDSYLKQTLPHSEYEIIWVEYYGKVLPELEGYEKSYSNFKLLKLDREGQWQYGICVNEGARLARGDILLISDGDVVVDERFLEDELQVQSRQNNLVNYHRRYDEVSQPEKYGASIDYLRQKCVLTNPTNYAGCFSIKKDDFLLVNGYEEDMTFSGPSACAKDAYVRFKNIGLMIRWDTKVRLFHPWHPGSAPRFVYLLSNQERIIQKRDLNVSTLPNCGYNHDLNLSSENLDAVDDLGLKGKMKEFFRLFLLRLLS